MVVALIIIVSAIGGLALLSSLHESREERKLRRMTPAERKAFVKYWKFCY